ncbi:MAG: phosphoglycerate mutase, partial [Thermotogaceae bacterium]|nr:phosphoglycerate mutase [Thermotogaceae bacterium]
MYSVDRQKLISKLAIPGNTKIILLVLDGLGDTPVNGKTPLQEAKTPNLDSLARESDLGLIIPVLPGITPGSG